MKDTEAALWLLSRHLHLEESVAHQVRKGRNLNTVRTYATAFTMGITYQSKCHTDKDFYYSLLTVAAPLQRYDTQGQSIASFFRHIDVFWSQAGQSLRLDSKIIPTKNTHRALRFRLTVVVL